MRPPEDITQTQPSGYLSSAPNFMALYKHLCLWSTVSPRKLGSVRMQRTEQWSYWAITEDAFILGLVVLLVLFLQPWEWICGGVLFWLSFPFSVMQVWGFWSLFCWTLSPCWAMCCCSASLFSSSLGLWGSNCGRGFSETAASCPKTSLCKCSADGSKMNKGRSLLVGCWDCISF